MKRLPLVTVTSVFLAAVAGCGGGGSNPDAAVLPDGTAAETAPASPFCTDKPAQAQVADVSGTWVARMVAAPIVSAPIVGALHVQSVFYILYNVRQDGAAVTIDGRYCDRTEIDPPGALVPVIIPAAWAHTEVPVQRTGTFVVGPGGFPILTLTRAVEINGALLASPTDPLPTEPNDARVVDVDNDGNPGLTVVLNGQSISGSVFSVQRQTTSVSAIVVAPNRIEGALTFESEQNVLASIPANIAEIYKAALTVTDPATCNSSFTMVKIADAQSADAAAVDAGQADGGTGSGVTCAWVRANEFALFAQ